MAVTGDYQTLKAGTYYVGIWGHNSACQYTITATKTGMFLFAHLLAFICHFIVEAD